MKEMQVFPLIALKNIVISKNKTGTIDISKRKSILALDEAMRLDDYVFFTLQLSENDPKDKEDFYTIGIVAKITEYVEIMPSVIRVTVQGVTLGKIEKIIQKNPFFLANICKVSEKNDIKKDEEDVYVKIIKDSFSEYAKLKGGFTPDILMNVISETNLENIYEKVIGLIDITPKLEMNLMALLSKKARIEGLLTYINKCIQKLNVESDIIYKVKLKIDKSQKDYYLKEHLKVIKEELGENPNIQQEVEEYKILLQGKNLPQYVKDKLEKEVERLSKIPNSSAEYGVCNDYINFTINLPWEEKSIVNNDIKSIQKYLDNSHFGLDKVKERIVEHIAVMQKVENINAPIICLLGPPGVGKTSIAKSIANALNIKYNRISLGGLRDEAEIRGHRKTYIGAMAGRVIKAVNDTKTNNPLILFDEIDKISSDFRGDPASALLEVLDKEQNKEFKDNYLEIPFDISNVLFICTANDISKVPPALKDRLEIIQLSSYTLEEKEAIASKFLIPKKLEEHNLTKSNLKISKNIINSIISEYTRETGVRQLERHIATICRKTLKIMLEDEEVNTVSISTSNLSDFLGYPKFKKEKLNKKSQIGCVRGLAWTSVGGTTLDIEVSIMEGSGKTIITGNVGKVMNESAQTAISYARANYKKYNISKDFYKKNDIHIHIPEGATPKDGPSAGITIVSAVISALSNKRVDRKVAMTGEVTLRGNVLAIGGLKEKILAGKRIGIKKIIIPMENKSDFYEMPDYIKDGIEILMVENVEQVLEEVFVL